MARGKARTKRCSTLVKDLGAEDLSMKSFIFGDNQAEENKSRIASDNEDSVGSQEDEDIYMKKQGSGMVYDRTPAKRGNRDLQAPAYTAKRKLRNLYTKKGYESSREEEQYKSKDAGDVAPDRNDSGDDGDDDSSKDKEEKVTNPDDARTFFQSICKLPP